MKIQILSDTHTFDYELNSEADVIVHAGDFSNNLKGCLKFDKDVKALGKIPIFVLGNHDYYGSSIKATKRFFEQNPQYNCLYPGKTIEVGGYTFVGGTLFTNFRKDKVSKKTFKLNKNYAVNYVRDFESIFKNVLMQPLEPEDMVEEFNTTLEHIQTFKGKEKTVVVTHFPPSLKCLDPYWGVHPTASVLNPYFINDLDVSGFKLWISGHTHTAVDDSDSGCRLLINPYGYPNEHGTNGFRNKLLLDLNEIYKNA